LITALDTNILLDILTPGATDAKRSKASLDSALADGALILCELVYGELVAQFGSQEATDGFVDSTGLRIQPISREALSLAGLAWSRYSRSRPRGFAECPRCGTRVAVSCPKCVARIQLKQHLLADFVVGAHARVHADRLLTRDLGYYRTYYPDLVLLTP
jgi:hypothetical protein